MSSCLEDEKGRCRELSWCRDEETETHVNIFQREPTGLADGRNGPRMGQHQGEGGGRVMHVPRFWLELFAEMEKPGKGASGLEDKTRSNLLSAKCCEAGLGQDEPRAGGPVQG